MKYRLRASIGLHTATLAQILCGFGCLREANSPRTETPQPSSLSELLAAPSARLSEVPLIRMDLICAEGLSKTGQPDIETCASAVAAWAARVRTETDRHEYRFRRNPSEFENSEGYFRMLMMTVVLAEDCEVHYASERITLPSRLRPDDNFFANPEDVFLHGLLGPERKGTCSSMPVLYVAIGRELGYPLKLVTTKGHLFVRWEGSGERFNIEATSRGLNRFADDYYRHWPFEITADEEAAEGYLKSLTPPEELAVFLSIRGMCLREAGRASKAAEAFAAAARFAPTCRSYRMMAAALHKQFNKSNSVSKSTVAKSN